MPRMVAAAIDGWSLKADGGDLPVMAGACLAEDESEAKRSSSRPSWCLESGVVPDSDLFGCQLRFWMRVRGGWYRCTRIRGSSVTSGGSIDSFIVFTG